jgi:hypothetical protein
MLTMIPCTSRPSPTATLPPPSCSAKAGARATKPASAPSPTSPIRPNQKSTPSAACSRTSPLVSPQASARPPKNFASRPCRSHPHRDPQTRPGCSDLYQALPRAGSGPGHDGAALARSQFQVGPHSGNGMPPAWPRNWESARPAKMTCIRPWTGSSNDSRASRESSPPATCTRAAWCSMT